MLRLFLILILAVSSLSAQAVKFGFVLPLGIIHGQSYRDCALLAKEDFGEATLDYEFIFEDNNYELARTNLVAQKFLSVDKVDVIWSVWGMFANVVEPLAAKQKTLHVTSAFGFKQRGESLSLNGAPYNESEVRLLLGYLQQEGLTRLAIVYVQEPGLMMWIEHLRELAGEYDVEIVSDQMIKDTQRDLRMQVLKAREAAPQAVWVDLWEPTLQIFVRQGRELGLDLPMLSRDDAYITEEFAALFEGEVGLSSGLPKAAWVERFQERFGYVPVSYAWIYYDQVRSLMDAYETLYAKNSAIPSARELKDYLLDRRYSGGPLGDVYYDQSGRLINQPTLVRIIDAQPVPFELNSAQ